MNTLAKLNRINWPVILHIAEGPQRENDALLRWRAQFTKRGFIEYWPQVPATLDLAIWATQKL